MGMLAYADGKNDLLTIAEKLNVPMWSLFNNIEMLLREKLIKKM